MTAQKKDEKGLNRRDFLKCSAVLGGALLASQVEWAADLMRRAEAGLLTRKKRMNWSRQKIRFIRSVSSAIPVAASR